LKGLRRKFQIEVQLRRVYLLFRILLKPDEVGSLASIGVVMLPEALAYEAEPQHLNGKRGARLKVPNAVFASKKNLIIYMPA